MSTATTAQAPLVRSNSRRQQAFTSPAVDHHSRTVTTASRTQTSASDFQGPDASSQTRRLSASYQAPLVGVAQRDQEILNLARPPSSRQSSSKDHATAHDRNDSSRGMQRGTSRSGIPRPTSDMVPPSSSGTNSHGGPLINQHVPQPRRRTTISTQTGEWSLGKTIGAGSMGKVKLAKHMETGEQVTCTWIVHDRV